MASALKMAAVCMLVLAIGQAVAVHAVVPNPEATSAVAQPELVDDREPAAALHGRSRRVLLHHCDCKLNIRCC